MSLLGEKNHATSIDRAVWLKIALALALLSGFLLSLKLWSSARSYPLTPVFGWLPEIPAVVGWIWLASLLVLLGAIVIARQPGAYILAFLLLAGLLSLFDQSRWQPWFYQYLFMFAALFLYPWREQNPEKRDTALNICRLIIASIYFWSGVQKMNVSFIEDGFPALVEPLIAVLPGFAATLILPLAILVPFVEAGMGIGLLTRRFRGVALVTVLGMHAFILFSIGPLGSNWNTVVWPWNLAMMVFVVALFWRAGNFSARDVLIPRNSFLHGLVLLLFGAMPFFSFFGLWDSYLSASLYSENTEVAAIYVSDKVKERLPETTRDFAVKTNPNGHNVVSIIDWSFEELNVPPYLESRVFKNVTRHVCSSADNPSEVKLLIQGKPSLVEGTRATRIYDCSGIETGIYEAREPA